MAYICPATGHAVNDPDGRFCGDHGVNFFTKCRVCGEEWPLTWDPRTDGEKGTDFCAQCGTPAPWLPRRRLIQWLQVRVQESDLEPAMRLELQDILGRLAQMAPDDTKAVAGWERLRASAPKIWEKAKPIIDSLVTEAMKKLLGL